MTVFLSFAISILILDIVIEFLEKYITKRLKSLHKQVRKSKSI